MNNNNNNEAVKNDDVKNDDVKNDDVKAQKKLARKARNDTKKAALQLLIKAVEKSGDAEALKAITTLTASQGRSSGDNRVTQFVAFLQKQPNKVATLRQLFDTFQVGKAESKKLVRHAVKHAHTPEKRAWVMVDGDNYVLVHVGAQAPAGYKGFIPDTM